MSLIIMTNEELKAIGINGQLDSNLDLQHGCFTKDGWRFIKEDIANDGNQFINVYFSERYSFTIYIVQNETESVILDGISLSNYQF
jgi:hypothetical protein